MGKKGKRKDDYWESGQAESDYNDSLVEEVPDPKDVESGSDSDGAPAPNDGLLDSDDEDREFSDEEPEETNYTHGELNLVVFKVRKLLTNKKEKNELPVTKESLLTTIEEACSVKRRLPFFGIYQILLSFGVLIESDREENDEPEVEDDSNDNFEGETDKEKLKEKKQLLAQIDAFTNEKTVRFENNWEALLRSNKVKRALTQTHPVEQHCIELIFENLVRRKSEGTFPKTTKQILLTLYDLSDMDHPIPAEDVVQVLEDDEYITIAETQKKSAKNKQALVSYKIEYADKLFIQPQKKQFY